MTRIIKKSTEVRNDDEWKLLWSKATFVFDTNVLLFMYLLPEDDQKQLVDFLVSISDRIWIPYQVALEFSYKQFECFQKGFFAQQVKDTKSSAAVFETKRSEQKKSLLESKSKILKLFEQYPHDSDLKMQQDLLESSFLALLKQIDDLTIPKVKKMPLRDELLDQISDLFYNKIGLAPEGQEAVDDLVKEAERRAALKIAPGFKDFETKKSAGKIDCGIVYKDAAGDYILWSQMLDYAKQNKKEHLFFVTREEKSDWWRNYETPHGRKRRPDQVLIDEALTKGGVTDFQIYSLADFKKYSSKYLGATTFKQTEPLLNDPEFDRQNSFDRDLTIDDLYRGSDPRTLENRNTIYWQCWSSIVERTTEYIKSNSNFDLVMLADSPFIESAVGITIVQAVPQTSKFIRQPAQPDRFEVNVVANWQLLFRPISFPPSVLNDKTPFRGSAQVSCEIKLTLVRGYGESLLVERAEIVKVDHISFLES
jgi:PIN like domain